MTFIDYSRVQPMTQNDWYSLTAIIITLIIFGTIALWYAVKSDKEDKNE